DCVHVAAFESADGIGNAGNSAASHGALGVAFFEVVQPIAGLLHKSSDSFGTGRVHRNEPRLLLCRVLRELSSVVLVVEDRAGCGFLPELDTSLGEATHDSSGPQLLAVRADRRHLAPDVDREAFVQLGTNVVSEGALFKKKRFVAQPSANCTSDEVV